MGGWGQCLKKCHKNYWIVWMLVPNLWFLISPQWFAVDSEPDDLLLSDLYLGWKCVDLLFYFLPKCVTLSALDCLESCPLIKSKDTGIYKKYEIWNISCIHIHPKSPPLTSPLQPSLVTTITTITAFMIRTHHDWPLTRPVVVLACSTVCRTRAPARFKGSSARYQVS